MKKQNKYTITDYILKYKINCRITEEDYNCSLKSQLKC